MHVLSKAHGLHHPRSLNFFSNLIDRCFSLKTLYASQLVHAQLIKVGFNNHTFLGNRCVDLYSKVGSVSDALRAFDEIENKNVISWNICLRVYVKSGILEEARKVFDKMTERDVVSWNTMISGYALKWCSDKALELFKEMQYCDVRPNEFTYSALTSSVYNAYHGKQIHGYIMRSGTGLSNLVVSNSLIDMYGVLGLPDYAFGVFLTMDDKDIISWNSLISSFCKAGHGELALDQFYLMVSDGYSPDEFTLSTMTTVFTNLRDLERGKQTFAFCIKMGFLSNTIVSSATIDLFSKCDRLGDSIQLFEEINIPDTVICNSMISSYARHGFAEEGLQLFLLMLQHNLKPTEFTLSSVLTCASLLISSEQGSQLHSVVVKLGMESDAVVASSLVEMYAKFGFIDASGAIFDPMGLKDLISWNTMILGLSQNGRVAESLELFKELILRGPAPDGITLLGALLACCYGGLLQEGMTMFSSMEKEYGVTPGADHYLCVIDMMCQASKPKEALGIIEEMPCEPSPLVWELVLHACAEGGDLQLTERVAKELMQCEPRSPLPYLVLARAYEMRGRWESLVRVRKAMKDNGARKPVGCSWIPIRDNMFVFKANNSLCCEDKNIYLILRSLDSEMEAEDSFCSEL